MVPSEEKDFGQVVPLTLCPTFVYAHCIPAFGYGQSLLGDCNEHGTIYAISSDFGDRMTTQSMGQMILLSEYF